MSNIETYTYGPKPNAAGRASEKALIQWYWGDNFTHDNNRGVAAALGRHLTNSLNVSFTVIQFPTVLRKSLLRSALLPVRYFSSKIQLLTFSISARTLDWFLKHNQTFETAKYPEDIYLHPDKITSAKCIFSYVKAYLNFTRQ